MNTFWVRKNCIGRGSFGVVNLAVKGFNSELFAVKSVNKNSIESIRCLENEIRILKSLSSPYIVSYIGDDVTYDTSSFYRNLHIEYMPNGTVADVAKHGYNCMNIKNYTRCITSALSYIHGKNIVHCDVKGNNVLIGNIPGTAKLADFGSAVEIGAPGTRGSPLWMAPEVVRGEYQGPESDVWSLGCTVIEMITGKPPWQERGADTFRQIGYADDLPELQSSTPIADDLRDFLNKCLKRERSERWSCDQLLHHPFLLSCISPPTDFITISDSPRCVFDWRYSSSSNESTFEIDQLEMKTSNAKQRIGKLCSTSGVNWESEGWEMVRHVIVNISSELLEPGETTSEYSEFINEEGSVSGSGRVNWEYTETYTTYSYNHESTTNDAGGTTLGSKFVFVFINKLFPIKYFKFYPTYLLYDKYFFLIN